MGSTEEFYLGSDGLLVVLSCLEIGFVAIRLRIELCRPPGYKFKAFFSFRELFCCDLVLPSAPEMLSFCGTNSLIEASGCFIIRGDTPCCCVPYIF